MSRIEELRGRTATVFGASFDPAELKGLLAEIDAAVKRARIEGMREAACQVCHSCAEGIDLSLVGLTWVHGIDIRYNCDADKIHDLIAQAEKGAT